jgi:hypothetical protein
MATIYKVKVELSDGTEFWELYSYAADAAIALEQTARRLGIPKCDAYCYEDADAVAYLCTETVWEDSVYLPTNLREAISQYNLILKDKEGSA